MLSICTGYCCGLPATDHNSKDRGGIVGWVGSYPRDCRETNAACQVREIKEELNVDITVGWLFQPVTHDYKHFSLQLYPFICQWVGGELLAREHARAILVSKDELLRYDWAAADVPVAEEYLRL